jgi:hypothetical protein
MGGVLVWRADLNGAVVQAAVVIGEKLDDSNLCSVPGGSAG